MRKINSLFGSIFEPDPPRELADRVLKSIRLEEAKQIRRKLVFAYTGLAVSVSSFVFAVFLCIDAFVKSDFWSIFSLAFSDFVIVAGSWKEYLYSLGETLPIANSIAILVPVLGMLVFLSFLKSLKNSEHIGGNVNMQAFQH